MPYYTNVYKKGNTLYIREILNGSRITNEVKFQPTIWSTNKPKENVVNGWTDLYNKEVYPIKLGSMGDLYTFKDNNTVHTSPGPVYQFINEYYPKHIDWDFNDLRIYAIDIETEVENSYSSPENATERVQLITIEDINKQQIITFGLYPFNNPGIPNLRYVECHDEASLLRNFIAFWSRFYPDVITGWNISNYDMPYLYNRIVQILGEDIADKMSPYHDVYKRTRLIAKKEYHTVDIAGISQLDYLILYKKFTYNSQESYTLGYISSIELGETKVENPYESFKEFYTKDRQLFIEYNIQDTVLIHKLEDKLKLLNLALTMAYDAKIQYEDVFSPIKTWDVIVYNYLNDNKKVIPNKDPNNIKTRSYGGGYVKPPLIGRHDWVVSLDVTSLYPSLIMSYQISPEKITKYRIKTSVNELLNESVDTSALYTNDFTMTANGCCFKKGTRGVFPTLIQLYFDKRTQYNKELAIVEKELENIDKTTNEYIIKKNRYSDLNNKQKAMKILLNSLYGALGTDNFRYFDLRMAEGITFSGQLTIRWVSDRLNTYINSLLKQDKDRIVLIDTDSIVINLSDFVNKYIPNKSTAEKIAFIDKITNDKIQPYVKKCIEELAHYTNMYDNKIKFARENLVDTMISVQAKKYVMSVCNSKGINYAKPKLKIMGLEMIKSSTPKIIRDKLKKSLDLILYSTEEKTQQFIADFRKEYNKLSILDISFPRGVSNLWKYADNKTIYKPGVCTKENGKQINTGVPVHVRGSLLYNHYINKYNLNKTYELIQDGDKIKFVYMKLPNPIGEDIFAFHNRIPKELDLERFVDYNTMFEKTFLASIDMLLVPLNWKNEAQNNLFDFL